MLVEIELLGTPHRWSCRQRRVRIGRDASCDVSLQADPHSTVSREHATLVLQGELLQLTDNGSANGTYLNGVRVNASTVRSGDTIQLGVDGPQLCVRLVSQHEADASDETVLAPGGGRKSRAADTSDAILASGAVKTATLKSGVFDSAAINNTDTPTVLMGGAPTGADTAQRMLDAARKDAARQGPHGPGVRVMLPAESRAASDLRQSSPAVTPPVPRASGIGDERVIEKKLNGLRNLLAANLVVLVLLLLGILYQNQQIAENRDAIGQLQRNATSAVQKVMPELDTRLNSFEKQMDAFDHRMNSAQDQFTARMNAAQEQFTTRMTGEEDHFVARMERELPKVMDKYVNQKLNQAKRQAQDIQP